jgi:hypothetical protein
VLFDECKSKPCSPYRDGYAGPVSSKTRNIKMQNKCYLKTVIVRRRSMTMTMMILLAEKFEVEAVVVGGVIENIGMKVMMEVDLVVVVVIIAKVVKMIMEDLGQVVVVARHPSINLRLPLVECLSIPPLLPMI